MAYEGFKLIRYAREGKIVTATVDAPPINVITLELYAELSRMSREVEKSLFGSPFEISRLLPSAGDEFQYRVKNIATGQERVVSEGDIVPFDPPG